MASPSKTPPESSDQAQELAETLKNLIRGVISVVDSFVDQLQTALSRKSEPSRPHAQVNNTQANLHDREKLKAAEASLLPASSCASQFHQDSVDPSKHPTESSGKARHLPKRLKNLALLGLRFNKNDSYKHQLQTALFQKSKPFGPPAQAYNLQAHLHDKEKLKAGHVPATLIKIGSWQFTSTKEADLVGKFYFATRKLAWEVLENSMKYKIEIRWEDISAIRAFIEENKPAILEIELRWPPSFYKATGPPTRHHTVWIETLDFTDGQALTCWYFMILEYVGHILQISRRHHLVFPPAALDKNYIRLLSSDHRLLELSRSGFPSSTEKTFCMLQNSGFENPQMTQVSNTLSQSEALPSLRPAAAANPDINPREQLNSPNVGEAGVPTFQIPAIMRKTQRQLVSDPDPISSYQQRILSAITSTFTPPIGSLSTVSPANNGNTMDVQEKHDG